MKQVSAVVFSLFALVLTGFAQAPPPPPPPPPAIYASPVEGEVKERVFDECGYAVSLAGNIRIGDFPGACSGVSFRRVAIEGSVRRLHFSDADFTKHSRTEILADSRNAWLNKRLTLLSEKDVKTAGFDGKEFEIGDTLIFGKLRAFFVNNDLFEIYVELKNRHIHEKYHPELIRAFNQEANEFFASFRLLKQ